MRSEALDHEACDVTGDRVAPLDTNGDGKPDLYRVFDRSAGDKDAHEVCRVVDLNHDGRPDLYEYFDGSGAIRRREFCYDDTGVVNAIEVYKGGKLAERVYDTTGQHKIDTWDWFDPSAAVDAKTGRPSHPVRRERDLRGDGNVNQWWTWSGDSLTIATDRNGDGQPDPNSVIVLGGDGGTPESPPAGAASEGGAPGAAPAPGTPTATDGGLADGSNGAKS
ncbi:MAG: hypothetical protein JOZ69_25890 [Myxococcales bacterium]|nr:hypothetical protein [Myxococcales bacterium]